MRLILIGFATSYKTSVGQILAQKLGAEFWDTDWQVEKLLGQSVAQIFQTQGEQAFRKVESQVLESLQNAQGVISCGGGAVLSQSFPDFVQNATVVWLQSSPQTIYDRLQHGTRPLFDGKSAAELQAQLAERTPLYQKYATLCVPTDGKTSQQVAEEIAQQIQ